MSKFAKLYDVEDTQILVQLTENDDGFPMVKYTTHIEGGYVHIGPVIEPKDGIDFDDSGEEEKAWSAAEKLFESVDEVKAIETHKEIIKWVNSMADESDDED